MLKNFARNIFYTASDIINSVIYKLVEAADGDSESRRVPYHISFDIFGSNVLYNYFIALKHNEHIFRDVFNTNTKHRSL